MPLLRCCIMTDWSGDSNRLGRGGRGEQDRARPYSPQYSGPWVSCPKKACMNGPWPWNIGFICRNRYKPWRRRLDRQHPKHKNMNLECILSVINRSNSWRYNVKWLSLLFKDLFKYPLGIFSPSVESMLWCWNELGAEMTHSTYTRKMIRMHISDSIGDSVVAGDTRWGGSFGVNVDFVARR